MTDGRLYNYTKKNNNKGKQTVELPRTFKSQKRTES